MNWIRLAVAERKIAVLEEKLEEKADYIPHRVALAMAKFGYKLEGKDKSLLDDIEDTVKDKKKEKEKNNKFVKSLTEYEKQWKPIYDSDSPYMKENTYKPAELERAGVKMRWTPRGVREKHVHVKGNTLEKQLKKLRPTKITFNNDAIHIKRHRYHRQKMKEKDDEIEIFKQRDREMVKQLCEARDICRYMRSTHQCTRKTGEFVGYFKRLVRKLEM
tara:strand:- start:2160 stop:2810 length:651 start_codon:yes stop_codon:yes gene_type:complete